MVKDVTNVQRTPSGLLIISSAPTVFGRGRAPEWSLGERPEGLWLVQVKPDVVRAAELRAEDLRLIAHLSSITPKDRGYQTGQALTRMEDAVSTLGIW